MNSDPRVYVFGNFRFDLATQRLERGGELITLNPKAFQLLLLLVERAGSLVTREELIETLWPDVVVHENNLIQHVSLLRKQLGQPDYIETVPRVGYRFAAEVRRETASEIHAVPRPRWYRAAVPALVVLLLLVVIAIALTRSHTASTTRAPIRSIAVLALRPIGPPEGIEGLGKQISDAVTQRLTALFWLEVRSTSAVQKYSGRDYDVRRAAAELNVDAIVEGTIQRDGDRVRIRVQLVDIRRGVPIFSGRFDEKATDVSAIQDVVFGAVARALGVEKPREALR